MRRGFRDHAVHGVELRPQRRLRYRYSELAGGDAVPGCAAAVLETEGQLAASARGASGAQELYRGTDPARLVALLVAGAFRIAVGHHSGEGVARQSDDSHLLARSA